MKNTKWLALVAAVTIPLLSGYAQAPAAGAANISPNAAEVVKLAGSGVGDDVVLAYVQNSQALFNLTADNVLYLRDVGVSQPVITAMLNHDSALRSQVPQSPPPQYAPAATAPAPAPAPAPVMETQPVQAVAAPPTYVSSPPPDVSYFYNDLAPYGAWVSLPGVGWCWQPSVVVVNRGWRPYCDAGHWVYTDAGWFWQSDYSWGWAPFHYGRWYLDARCGWAWVPGRVWGPAWVTWRTAGTTCGWAPLPPGADFVAGIGWRWNGVTVGASFDFGLGVNAFAFVSFGDFCAHDVYHHCLPPDQVRGIYRQTTIVNNYTVVNNTYINRGIPVERIGAASHTPVPRATIHEGPAGVGGPAGAGGAYVYRTQLKAPGTSGHMVAQKVDSAHPVIQHTSAATPRYDQKSPAGGSGPSSTFQHTTSPGLRGETKPLYSGSVPTTTWQHTPNAPVKGQQTAPLGSSVTGSQGASTGKYQAGGNTTSQWQSPERASPNPRNLSAPKTYQSQQLKQDTRSLSGSQSATTASPYSQGAVGKSQSALAGEGYKGSAHPYGGTSQGQATLGQTTPQTPTSHFYNPKTVEQSSQVRSIYQQPKGSSPTSPGTGHDSGSKKNQ